MNQYKASDIINELYLYDNRLTEEADIIEKYISPDKNIGKTIEFPDRISNINGMHLYKLLSVKDIDFNNVLLPNSVVPETNWGSFDENRRWPSGYPIHLNDGYELLNVIDYLLCATEDLWSEINKLKYGSNIISSLWFINNLNQQINQIYALSSSQFTKNSQYTILLDPRTYFSTLPQTSMANFGIGTYFFDDDHNKYPILRRVIQKSSNRNGINAYIEYEDYSSPYRIQNENIEGNITSVYGYKIGTDLHFYPMFNIDNYFVNNKIYYNYSELVDVVNLKLKYDTYFRVVNNGISEFKKVYVDFLYHNFSDIGYPYILYFIDGDKKNIIYIHTTAGEQYKQLGAITNELTQYPEYVNYFSNSNSEYSLDAFGGEQIVYSVNEGVKYPYLFYISDAGQISLFVQTPNTPNFSLANNTLPINYFKYQNMLSAFISISGETDNIVKYDDTEIEKSKIYQPSRYNIPDNKDINIDINGTFLKNNSNIKFDDEFIDVLLPMKSQNVYVSSDTEAKQYYYYNGLSQNGKRNFVQFNTANELNSFFGSDNANAIKIQNIDNITSVHVYIKNEDAYKLKCEFTTTSLLAQIANYDDVKTQTQNIKNNSQLIEDENKYTLKFNYKLPDQIEQVKFDIDLSIDETSKVSKTNLKLPISMNKVHQPCIQFVSKELMEKEIDEYDNYLAYTFGDRNNTDPYYRYINKTFTDIMTNTAFGSNSDYYKTNQNTIQGSNDEDRFPSFKDIYSYVIETKYNNFQVSKNDGSLIKRTDLMYNINSNNQLPQQGTLESTFSNSSTYDNTISGSKELYISYNPNNPLLNLIGSEYIFNKYLKDRPHSFAYIQGVTYYPIDGVEKYIHFNTIFTINGLGFNYRLHGGDSYLYINRDGGAGNNNGTQNLSFNHQYDLECNACLNNLNNISKYMTISLSDNNNQFENVSGNGSNLSDSNHNLIENKIVDVHSVSYVIKVQNDFDRLGNKRSPGGYNYNNLLNTINNWATTYYVPITYMNIKDTTFYPNNEILPTNNNHKYNFNQQEDLNRYRQYINFWDSTDETGKNKPITLSLKLNKNMYANTPFFYESNTAKVKFNIIRANVEEFYNDKYSITGIPTVYLAFGSKYYLSDCFDIQELRVKNISCIGSYPEYNESTEKYDIKEIYGISSMTDSPAPIFNNEYDIDKIAALNKLKLENPKINNVDISVKDYIDYNTLFTITINDDVTTGILGDISNDPLDLLDANGILFKVDCNIIYGNKLYKNTSTTSDPHFNIRFITRTITDRSIYNNDIKVQDAVGNIITTNNRNSFQYYTSANEYITLKHKEFKRINGSNLEVFIMPNYNLDTLKNIYIYNETIPNMVPLSTYQDFRDGINNQDKYTKLYNTILAAFKANKIYDKVS